MICLPTSAHYLFAVHPTRNQDGAEPSSPANSVPRRRVPGPGPSNPGPEIERDFASAFPPIIALAEIPPHDHSAKDQAWESAPVRVRELYADWTLSQLCNPELRTLDEAQWRLDLQRLQRFVPAYSTRAQEALRAARQHCDFQANKERCALALAQAQPGTGTAIPDAGLHIYHPTTFENQRNNTMRQIQQAAGRSFSHHDVNGPAFHAVHQPILPPPTHGPDDDTPVDLDELFNDGSQIRQHHAR